METNEKISDSIAKKLAGAAHSRIFKITTAAVLFLIIITGVFGLGMAVGYRKANFSYNWGENYHRNFGGPRNGFFRQMPMMFGNDFISAHGTTGLIIKIDGNNLVVDGNNTPEKIVVVSDKTIIRNGQQDIKLGDLKIGELVVVVGNPNAGGQIEAILIRVFNSK